MMVMILAMTVLGTIVAMSRNGTFHKIVFPFRRARNRLPEVTLVADLVAEMVATMTTTPLRRTMMVMYLQLHNRILRLGLGRGRNVLMMIGILMRTGRLSLVGRPRSSNSRHLPRWPAS